MWKWLLLAAALVAFLLSLLTGVTTIDPGERAVVRRFGRLLERKPRPGLHIGLPWGIDRVSKVKVDEDRSVTIGYEPPDEMGFEASTPAGQLLTGDHNLINIQAVIRYNIREEEVEKFVFQKDRAEALVARAAETVLIEWTSARGYDTVVATGKLAVAAPGESALRDLLVGETQRRLAPYQLGVQIKSADISWLNPPSEVRAAYDNVTRNKTRIKTQKYEAFQYRDTLLQGARTTEHRLLSGAHAYAEEQKNAAYADAKNFAKSLAQYRLLKKNNPYYLNTVWWDTMSQLYAQMRADGRIDLLDHHLGANGLDITTMPPLPKNR